MGLNTQPSTISGKCNSSDSSLIVVDIQERLGAAMPGKVLNRVILNVSLLARGAGLLRVPVIKTEQYPTGLGPTQAAVVEALPANTCHLEKTSFSCCDADEFQQHLSATERTQVIL